MWIVYRVSIYNLSSYYFVFIKNPYIQRHLDIGTMGSHDQEKYSVFQGYFIKKFGIEFKWNSLWGILTTRPFDRNILLCECQRWAFGFSYHGKRERESIYIYIYIISDIFTSASGWIAVLGISPFRIGSPLMSKRHKLTSYPLISLASNHFLFLSFRGFSSFFFLLNKWEKIFSPSHKYNDLY